MIGPTNRNVMKALIMIDNSGVVRLSSQVGVTLCRRFSMLAKIQDTASTGSTVPW